MSYAALPEKPASSSTFDSSSDDFHVRMPSKSSSKQLKGIWRLSAANLVLLVVQVVLLAVHGSQQWRGGFGGKAGKTIEATYGFDTKYMTIDHAYDWLWEDKAVERGGAIAVNKDKDGKVTEYGVISMFHQLHCLGSLRKALQRASEGEHVAFDQNEDPHWPHCMHYLHQTIMCKADGQIEKQETWNFTTPFISGAEDIRQCGDHKALFTLFDKEGA